MEGLARAARSGLVAVLSVLAGHAVAAEATAVAPNASEVDGAAAADHHATTVASAIDNDVLSRYAELKINADMLRRAIARWCEQGSSETPGDVRAVFATVVRHWASVDYFRFGPAREANRQQRIAFWPDPRGVVRKQVSRALAAKDASLLSTEAISGQSAALQGLPALEQLLFTTRADEADEALRYRCRLAEAIAGNVRALAGEMLDDWTKPQGWRDLIVHPGPANAAYRSEVESVSELVRTLLSGQQILRDQIMVPWIKAMEAEKHWGGLPFETSRLTPAYVDASAASLEELSLSLHLDQVAERLGDTAPDKKWIAAWMRGGYASIKRDADHLVLPAERGGDRPKISAKEIDALRRVKFYVNGLRQMVGKEIAPAAGALIGFNELDGD